MFLPSRFQWKGVNGKISKMFHVKFDNGWGNWESTNTSLDC